MFTKDEIATILNALRFYCHNNERSGEEAALSEKLNGMLKSAELGKAASTEAPNSLQKRITLKI